MHLLLPFQGDAPPAAGAATLWVHATIQTHKPYAADTRGVPNGFPQLLKMDSPNYGQPYYAELERSRDPLETSVGLQGRVAVLAASRLHSSARWRQGRER